MVGTVDKQYADVAKKILSHGVRKYDRTGTGTLSVFGERLEFDLSKEFPILTTKYVPLRHVFVELMWFLLGRNDVQWLNERGVTIWDEWVKEDGTIGKGYGTQWRDFNGYDQIQAIQDSLMFAPDSRRHIVSAWNPADISSMALPPCHMMFQCYVDSGKLSMQVYQRSVDWGLGCPFNLASYSMLTHLLAKTCGLDVGSLVYVFGDTHIYLNHIDAIEEQIKRTPLDSPIFIVNEKRENVWEYQEEDWTLEGYRNHGKVKMAVSR